MTTKHVVADEVLGKISRRQWEIYRRVLEGTLDPRKVKKELQYIIEGGFPENTEDQVFQIWLEEEVGLPEMILKGQYDSVHPDIGTPELRPRFFMHKALERRTVVLVCSSKHSKEVRTPECINVHLSINRLRPAELDEFLAFGAAHRDVQRRFPIITTVHSLKAPDMDMNLTRYLAPCLDEDDGLRTLGFINIYPQIPESVRYLAVKI